MSWIFVLALALIIFGVFCLSMSIGMGAEAGGGGGEVVSAFIFGVILLVAGLTTYHLTVMEEVNCYHDGGQVIDTQCMVVKGAVNGND